MANDLVDTFKRQLETNASEFTAALPAHIPPERFRRVVQTAVIANPDLLAADRRSLFESAMKAAQDGLLPDNRDGALVVYNTKAKEGGWIKKVQWMPMIGGVLKRIRNSGELRSISAHVVHERDEFAYVLGDDEKIEHRPALGERGDPILVYAIAHTKDGGIYREVMTVADVEKVRSVSRAANAGPWVQWWGEMARKTVLRRLAKRLPISADLDDLIRRDDELYEFDAMKKQARELADKTLSGRLTALAAPAPADEPEAIEDEPAAEAPESPAESAEPEAAAIPDALALAHESGFTAGRKGMSEAALPKRFAADPERAAWLAAHAKGAEARNTEGAEHADA